MGSKNLDENQWNQTTWGEIVELKYGKALKDYQGARAEFPVYGTNGAVGFCDTPLCQYPSVIVGRKGAYRGIHYSDKPFFVIDTAFYIHPLININLKWAYYHLLTQDINGLDSGSAIPSTRREDFYALPVNIPPRWIQDEIVNKLDSLERKITLNRQINQTLEQMAQTLFKSWFVDFDPVIDNALDAGNDIPDALLERAEQRRLLRAKADFKPLPAETRALFPSEFDESELGWVPKGWSYCFVKDIADINSESWNAKNSPETLEYLDLSNAKDGSIISTELYSFDDAPSRARRVLRKNDTVFGLVRPANKSFAYIDRDGLTGSTGFAVIRSKENCYKNYLYLCITDADVVDEFARIADGGAYPAIKNEDIADLQIIKPCKNLLTTFDLLASELRDKMAVNSTNNQTLTEIRDSLLPKLISGELALDVLQETPELVEAL